MALQIFNKLSFIGINPDVDIFMVKRVRLCNTITTTILLIIIPYALFFYYLGFEEAALYLVPVFFLFTLIYLFNRWGAYNLARIYLILLMNAALGYYALYFGKASGIHYLYLVFVTVPFLLFELRYPWSILLCVLASFVPFLLIEFEAGFLPTPSTVIEPEYQQLIYNTIIVLAFIWLVLHFIYLSSANDSYEKKLRSINEELNRRVREQTKDLQRKNEELEKFTYIASHDLQSPMQTIHGLADLLGDEYKETLDQEALGYITKIKQTLSRMSALVRDLLEYSHTGKKNDFKKIDCNEIVSDTLADLDASINQTGASVVFNGLPDVKGYETDLRQLFQNLITNAIKFRKEEVSPEVKITSRSQNGEWHFIVRDNGIGIDREHIKDIFQIFITSDDDKGCGIGLAQCKKIVERHGGEIWVESEMGQGSTFHFTISKDFFRKNGG